MSVPLFSRILKILSPGFLGGFAFPDWIHLMHANRWRVDAKYFPRAILAGFGSIVTSAIKVVEDRIELPPLPQDSLQQPLFILGLPRSGTTHLFHLLSEDPQFCFASRFDVLNPHTFLTLRSLGLASLFGKQSLRKRPMDNVMSGWLMPEEDNIALAIMTGFGTRIGAVFRRHRGQLFEELSGIANEGGPDAERFKLALIFFLRKLTHLHNLSILLKSPSHTLAIPQILSALPSARFVTIIRDPIAQFKSLAAMHSTSAFNWSALESAPPSNDNTLLDRIGLFARRYCATRGLIPERRLVEIRYEDLVEDEAGTLKRIYRKLDLKPRATTQPKTQKRYQSNEHPALPDELKARVIKVCAPFYELGPCRDSSEKLVAV
jgi:hypothetical protein